MRCATHKFILSPVHRIHANDDYLYIYRDGISNDHENEKYFGNIKSNSLTYCGSCMSHVWIPLTPNKSRMLVVVVVVIRHCRQYLQSAQQAKECVSDGSRAWPNCSRAHRHPNSHQHMQIESNYTMAILTLTEYMYAIGNSHRVEQDNLEWRTFNLLVGNYSFLFLFARFVAVHRKY